MLKHFLFDFQGRIGRITFFIYTVLVFLMLPLNDIITNKLYIMFKNAVDSDYVYKAILLLVTMVLFFGFMIFAMISATLALWMRRLHDVDVSGKYAFLFILLFIPTQTFSVFLPDNLENVLRSIQMALTMALCGIPGNDGPNRYGPPNGSAAKAF